MTDADNLGQARLHMRAARRRAGRLYRELGNRLVELRPLTAQDIDASRLLAETILADLAKAYSHLNTQNDRGGDA